MFKKYFSLLCLVIFPLLTACIDEFNADLGAADKNILVVEGNIYSDSLSVFYLSRSMGLNDYLYNQDLSVKDAHVAVTGTDGTRYEAQHKGSGQYNVNVGKLNDGVKYSLEIVWDDVTFVSEPSAPLNAPKIDSVFVSQPRPDKIVDVMVSDASAMPGETNCCRWMFAETWEVQAKYRPKYEYNPETDKVEPMEIDRSRGWCKGQHRDIIIADPSKFEGGRIKNFRINTISNTDQRLSVLYCCDVKQYAISHAQFEYEQARRELSSEMGGIFAPQPSELFSNIKASDKSHRAIGYVGVCGTVSSYRLWIPRGTVDYTDVFNRSIKELSEDDEMYGKPFSLLYSLGYRIIDENIPEMEPWRWTVRRGVDVTVIGASLIKPEFWPK